MSQTGKGHFLTFVIAPETEARLQAKAARRGQSLNEYAQDVLEHDAQEVEGPDESLAVTFSTDKAKRHEQIRALLHAPANVREATLLAGARAMAGDYANSEELREFSEALQGDEFLEA